jgi:hypothetical protein
MRASWKVTFWASHVCEAVHGRRAVDADAAQLENFPQSGGFVFW